MGIIYSISVILLFITYLLLRKTEKNIDILKQIVYGIVLLFCYNALICYILTFFAISITLLGLSIINLIFSLIMIFYIVKTKKVQKYTLNRIDIIYILAIGIVVLFISLLNFNFPFEIKYETGDPSVHYLTSEKFAEEDNLLAGTDTPDAVYGTLASRRFVSYVNSGLIMKCFQGVIDPFYNYVIFIIFGIVVLFLIGWMFYSTIAKFAKNRTTRFLAFLLAVLFTCGYPFNSLLYGFEYLSIAILILGAIVDSVNTYQNEEIGFKQNILVFFLLNFGLFNSYYMLVPYVYSALWIYFCIVEYKRQKKLFTFKTSIMLLVTLVIPFILGYIYCIAPNIYQIMNAKSMDLNKAVKSSNSVVNGLIADGRIYINIYSNMLLLLPLAIYALIKGWKENKAVGLITIFNILFIALLLVGNKFEKVSYYYLSKNYFALWLLLFYLNYKGIILAYEKYKYTLLINIALYLIILLVCMVYKSGNVMSTEPSPEEDIFDVVDIYLFNRDTVLFSIVDLTNEELEIIKYAEDNISKDQTIEVAGYAEQLFWQYVLTRRINKDVENKSGQPLLENKIRYVDERAGKVNYLIYFSRGKYYVINKEILTKDTEVVFENASGGILKYINVE